MPWVEPLSRRRDAGADAAVASDGRWARGGDGGCCVRFVPRYGGDCYWVYYNGDSWFGCFAEYCSRNEDG